MRHTGDQVLNSSQGGADARHVSLRGRRSNIPPNWNTNQKNLVHASTIIHGIKQQYPENAIVKEKLCS